MIVYFDVKFLYSNVPKNQAIYLATNVNLTDDIRDLCKHYLKKYTSSFTTHFTNRYKMQHWLLRNICSCQSIYDIRWQKSIFRSSIKTNPVAMIRRCHISTITVWKRRTTQVLWTPKFHLPSLPVYKPTEVYLQDLNHPNSASESN